MFLSTKDTIQKVYDGRFKNLFEEIFRAEFKDQFDAKGLIYQQQLIDDIVATCLNWYEKYVWACKTMMAMCSPASLRKASAAWV